MNTLVTLIFFILINHYGFALVSSIASYGASQSPDFAGMLYYFVCNVFWLHFFIKVIRSLDLVQPMLQELGKQNPQLMRLIQDHQADFLRLINEPVEGEGY